MGSEEDVLMRLTFGIIETDLLLNRLDLPNLCTIHCARACSVLRHYAENSPFVEPSRRIRMFCLNLLECFGQSDSTLSSRNAEAQIYPKK